MYLPITKPYLSNREFQLVQESLDSGWLVQGPKVKEFEERIARFTGAEYAVAVNSCTSGQFIMSRIVGLEPGDEVIVPAFTWISTANSVEFLGAKPVFCDIRLDTFNIDTRLIEEKITEKTRAIYPVSLFGLAADLPVIKDIAEKYNLEIVEDCACGLGAKVEGIHCGLFGKGGVLSFHPRKSITTGEGGMILTNDANVNHLARSLRDHGAEVSDYSRHSGSKSFRMSDYPMLGYNFRMTDLQGAIGIAQTEKLDEIFNKKKYLARQLNERLKGLSWLQLPAVPERFDHSYQTYCTLFKPHEAYEAMQNRERSKIEKLHAERNDLMNRLEEHGIMTRPGTHAVHIQKLYQERYGHSPVDFPASYIADRLTLALPFYPTMTQEERDYLVEQLWKMNP